MESLDKFGILIYNGAVKGKIMTEKFGKKVTFIYGICLAALTVIVGALFIMQIWAIYQSKPVNAFTAESIHEKFTQIAVPVGLWVGAVIIGGVLSYVFPEEEEKPKAYISVRMNLERLKGRLPQEEGGMVEVNKESRCRIIAWTACAACCVAATVISLLYLLDAQYVPRFEGEFFTGHKGAADRLLRIMPWVFGGLLACLAAWIYDTHSIKKETAFIKTKIAENAKKGIKPSKAEKKLSRWERICKKYPILKSKWWKYGLQIGLGVLSVALIIIGIFNGGMDYDVFDKAKKICTQCIGLG